MVTRSLINPHPRLDYAAKDCFDKLCLIIMVYGLWKSVMDGKKRETGHDKDSNASLLYTTATMHNSISYTMHYLCAFLFSSSENDIDMSICASITEDDLKEIGVSSFGIRRKIVMLLQQGNQNKNKEVCMCYKTRQENSVRNKQFFMYSKTLFHDLSVIHSHFSV